MKSRPPRARTSARPSAVASIASTSNAASRAMDSVKNSSLNETVMRFPTNPELEGLWSIFMPIKVTTRLLVGDIHNFSNPVDQDESRHRRQSLYNKYNWRTVFKFEFPDILQGTLY